MSKANILMRLSKYLFRNEAEASVRLRRLKPLLCRERRWLLLVLIVGAVGCSSVTTHESITVEEQVGARATLWAQLLMEGDYDAALGMTTPGFRKSPKADRYRADFGGAVWWQDVKLHRVTCDDVDAPERCVVRQIISLDRPPAVNNPVPIPYDSVWINLDGEWFIFHD